MKIPNFSIHDYIKWTQTDDKGEFVHQGQIVALDETRVSFRTAVGVMSVEYSVGTFEKVKNVKLEDDGPRTAVTATREPTEIVQRRRELKTDTKLAKAQELYKKLEDKSRKTVMKTFIEQLGLTPAGASTYQAICKRKFPSPP